MTFTQQGIITQYELAKILIVTSEGLIEVTLPLTDDDRRDMEIHIRGKFARSIAFQIKSTMHLDHRFRAYHLSMFFSVPKSKLITHPNFWYVFGYFDLQTMTFSDPVFIVPSAEVHEHASPRLTGDRWTFNFSASLDPNSHDRWRPWAVHPHGVGQRVLDILEEENAAPPLPAEVGELDGLMFVSSGSPRA